MTARLRLGTRALTDDDATERLNREIVPFVRQLAPGTEITGSRSAATVAILTKLLTVLSTAGVIKDSTTP